jgi:hypothetical protein
MPRVINGRNRNTTAKAILLKPYDQPITHALNNPASDTSTIGPDQIKSKEEVKPVKKGEYNKTHLVALIVKVSLPLEQADIRHQHQIGINSRSQSIRLQPVRPSLNELTGECRDTWRNTISPAPLAGKVWSNSGPGWDEGMKIKAVLEVVNVSRFSHSCHLNRNERLMIVFQT